jgi:ABC-type glycerol-3-phosphate transport system substrate-binding protein
LAADVNYDPNNMVAGTLEQVTRDGMLWGFPMSIAPVVIWYDPNLFEQAGLPMPENDWTISEWEDAVRALYDGENPVFQTQSFGGSYILMLAAAYGGVPIDYSSLPYTIVADPIAIQAVQEVLDLAKDGLLDYQELVGDSGFMGGGGGGGGSIPMFDSILIPNDWRLQNREGEFAEPYRVVMFPRGTDYIPVSYSLSAAFISAQSPAPDACYRWLSFLAQRPELLNGMPTRKDSFEAALAYITDGEDVVQLYQDMAVALESSDAIVLASPYGGGGENIAMSLTNYLVTTWLNLAFDNYVLEDGDLEADLLESQGYIGEYQECISAFPILSNAEMQEMESEAWEDYYFQFIRCAVDVDPALTDFFAYALEGEEE